MNERYIKFCICLVKSSKNLSFSWDLGWSIWMFKLPIPVWLWSRGAKHHRQRHSGCPVLHPLIRFICPLMTWEISETFVKNGRCSISTTRDLPISTGLCSRHLLIKSCSLCSWSISCMLKKKTSTKKTNNDHEKKTHQKSSQKQPFCFTLLPTHTPLHKAPPWAPQMFTSTRGIPSHMKFPRWRKTSRLAYEFLYCIKWRKAWKKHCKKPLVVSTQGGTV